MEHFHGTYGNLASPAALVHQNLYLLVGHLTSQQLMYVHRHAYTCVETLHGLYTLQGCSLRVREIVGHAHHVHGKLHETVHMLVQHIASPAAPECCKSGTVCHPEQTAQLMLQAVRSEILLRTTLRQVVVCQ